MASLLRLMLTLGYGAEGKVRYSQYVISAILHHFVKLVRVHALAKSWRAVQSAAIFPAAIFATGSVRLFDLRLSFSRMSKADNN